MGGLATSDSSLEDNKRRSRSPGSKGLVFSALCVRVHVSNDSVLLCLCAMLQRCCQPLDALWMP